MPSFISNNLPGFEPSEWDVLPPSSLVRHNELPPGIEVLAFSVAAQLPGGGYHATELLDIGYSRGGDVEDRLRFWAGQRYISLVICSTNASGTWSFKICWCLEEELRPHTVLVMRTHDGGWRAMIKKIMRFGLYLDPLPLWGIEADRA